MQFLREDSTVSTTRVVLILGMITVLGLSGGMLYHIIWKTTKGLIINWGGLTMFIGGLSTLLATLVYGKVTQKRIEVDNINKDSRID